MISFAPKNGRIDRYHRAGTADAAWLDEIARRSAGSNLGRDEDFFWHMNPLFEPVTAMRYVVGRYEAAFSAIASLKPKTVLEIGCAHGLSTWLSLDFCETAVGCDTAPSRIAVARHLFPEVEWVCDDWRRYVASRAPFKFDAILNSHGPEKSPPDIFEFCNAYVYVGYRPPTWQDALTGAHKLPGRQYSFSTTLCAAGARGVDPAYASYYFRRNYLKELRHALTNGYAAPL
jgi:hypothetical protein